MVLLSSQPVPCSRVPRVIMSLIAVTLTSFLLHVTSATTSAQLAAQQSQQSPDFPLAADELSAVEEGFVIPEYPPSLSDTGQISYHTVDDVFSTGPEPAAPPQVGGQPKSTSFDAMWTHKSSQQSRYDHHAPHELTPYFYNYENGTNITAQLGSTAYLDCRVKRLKEKTVSWVKREGSEIRLLTWGLQTYSNDARYSLNFENPYNWKLQIKYTQSRDAGTYECQVSTHPPIALVVNLRIVAPVVEIIDERGANVGEKFYKTGSTIELRCTISQMPQAQTFILWRHGDHMLNYDTSRGGISVKTDMSSSVIVSTLFIANATPRDSGNYTCSLGDVATGGVLVHILNGEHPAAMARDNSASSSHLHSLTFLATTAAMAVSGLMTHGLLRTQTQMGWPCSHQTSSARSLGVTPIGAAVTETAMILQRFYYSR